MRDDGHWYRSRSGGDAYGPGLYESYKGLVGFIDRLGGHIGILAAIPLVIGVGLLGVGLWMQVVPFDSGAPEHTTCPSLIDGEAWDEPGTFSSAEERQWCLDDRDAHAGMSRRLFVASGVAFAVAAAAACGWFWVRSQRGFRAEQQRLEALRAERAGSDPPAG